jgi:hypothetical protein
MWMAFAALACLPNRRRKTEREDAQDYSGMEELPIWIIK